MTAKNETLYRDAPIEKLERIDEASVPDCGSGAIARLRAENGRRDRQLWVLTTALWLTLSTFALGVATFRQAPFIVVVGFIAARDVLIMLWISRDRAGMVQRAIDEIVRLQGAERIAGEERLRAEVARWNIEAAAYGLSASWFSSEPWPDEEMRVRSGVQQLLERRRYLVAKIAALRSGGHAAA